jgi:hypothetical protein
MVARQAMMLKATGTEDSHAGLSVSSVAQGYTSTLSPALISDGETS